MCCCRTPNRWHTLEENSEHVRLQSNSEIAPVASPTMTTDPFPKHIAVNSCLCCGTGCWQTMGRIQQLGTVAVDSANRGTKSAASPDNQHSDRSLGELHVKSYDKEILCTRDSAGLRQACKQPAAASAQILPLCNFTKSCTPLPCAES